MMHETESLALKPGDRIHARRACTWITHQVESVALVLSDVLVRGQSLVLTQDTIQFNQPLLSRIDEESSPLGRGGWPEGLVLWESPSDPLYDLERDRRREEANRLPLEADRLRALAVLNREMPLRSQQVSRDLYGGRGRGYDNPTPQARP